MTMGYTYILTVYLVILTLFLNYSSPIIFWLLMELNLLVFLIIFSFKKGLLEKQDSMNQVVFYFLIQSSASMLFLSSFLLSDWISIFNNDTMFLVSITFKLGLFPLMFWMFMIKDSLSNLVFLLLLSLQKLPLMSALYCTKSSIIAPLLILSLAIGSILMLVSRNTMGLLVASGTSYTYLMFFLFIYSSFSFVSFFTFYAFYLSVILSSKLEPYKNYLITAFVFFMGLPPLGLFFYKFVVSSELIDVTGMVEMLLFWFFSMVSLMGYLKFFHANVFLWNTLFKKKFFYHKIILFFIACLLPMIVFVY